MLVEPGHFSVPAGNFSPRSPQRGPAKKRKESAPVERRLVNHFPDNCGKRTLYQTSLRNKPTGNKFLGAHKPTHAAPTHPGAPVGPGPVSARRRRKLGTGRGGGHSLPPKMLFIGNNPHYLPPLWANQTELLMPRVASCCLWEVTGTEGRGAGRDRRRRWHLPGLRGFGPALI